MVDATPRRCPVLCDDDGQLLPAFQWIARLVPGEMDAAQRDAWRRRMQARRLARQRRKQLQQEQQDQQQQQPSSGQEGSLPQPVQPAPQDPDPTAPLLSLEELAEQQRHQLPSEEEGRGDDSFGLSAPFQMTQEEPDATPMAAPRGAGSVALGGEGEAPWHEHWQLWGDGDSGSEPGAQPPQQQRLLAPSAAGDGDGTGSAADVAGGARRSPALGVGSPPAAAIPDPAAVGANAGVAARSAWASWLHAALSRAPPAHAYRLHTTVTSFPAAPPPTSPLSASTAALRPDATTTAAGDAETRRQLLQSTPSPAATAPPPLVTVEVTFAPIPNPANPHVDAWVLPTLALTWAVVAALVAWLAWVKRLQGESLVLITFPPELLPDPDQLAAAAAAAAAATVAPPPALVPCDEADERAAAAAGAAGGKVAAGAYSWRGMDEAAAAAGGAARSEGSQLRSRRVPSVGPGQDQVQVRALARAW